MRVKTLLTSALFAKQGETAAAVALPHTWNALDGQDGGADYWRGIGTYTIELPNPTKGMKQYIEFQGANHVATVYCNGRELGTHRGGFSTFRYELPALKDEGNVLTVVVTNAVSDVYPQNADFTFYGGLYRDVNFIEVDEAHFDLLLDGTNGVFVTPHNVGKTRVDLFPVNAEGCTVKVELKDAEGNVVGAAETEALAHTHVLIDVKEPHLWNGLADPYCYSCEASILCDGEVKDTVAVTYGYRSFHVCPNTGFWLNGKNVPLRGVARHQDRLDKGWAISKADHEEDVAIIKELGANTIRLAHYQHDQYFYDLCDEYGMVVWAEIPYISQHLPNGRENTISQMKELIIQNYNHPSVVVWGLSNEITMKGEKDPDLIDNHKMLNDLCHEMDKTRLTTMAIVSMCPMDAEYIKIPDCVSWNHYFGWYGGDTSMNGPWFDKFHAMYPDIPVGCSEYGCEALNWHTSKPTQGDYTEEYQAYYHEELIKQLFTRKYMWATHVWNMFDFGADNRAEGGENGQNHKGLVTFDRKYKKDSFYAYKAWLSDDPFVHLCAKRYVDRVEDVTKITVYSNQPEVELFANGVSLGKKAAEDHFFYFDVPNKGRTKLVAVAGDLKDESVINKVETPNEAYRLREKGAILNWFDITEVEGYFSLNDKLSDIMANPQGQQLFAGMMKQMMASGGKDSMMGAGFEMTPALMQMMGGFTVVRLMGLMGAANVKVTKEQLLGLNAMLNRIKKAE